MDRTLSGTNLPGDGAPILQFSTGDFPERDRLGAWRDIFGRTVVKLEIEPLNEGPVHSEAKGCALPGLGLLTGSCSAVHLIHPRELIVDDELSFMVGPQGQWTASQLGRDPVLGSDDGVLMANGEVGAMTLPSGARFATFKVPAPAIAPLVPDLGAVIARRVPAETEALRLLRRYLGLFDDGEPMTPDLQRLAVTHVHDLLALALGASRDAAEIANDRGLRAARRHAIRADILDNLHRGDLTVAALARRHGVTPRYIQMLFEAEGTTFSEFVRARRLARAHRMLSDPRHADRTIGAIACEAGFSDPSNFNHAFRRLYGVSPSDVRAHGKRVE